MAGFWFGKHIVLVCLLYIFVFMCITTTIMIMSKGLKKYVALLPDVVGLTGGSGMWERTRT